MTFSQIISIWASYLPLSLAIWFILIIILLYFAKCPVHSAIRSFFTLLHEGPLQMANAINSTTTKLKVRNKEVLLSSGLEAVETFIEREFYRVNTIVERDLSGFPVLKRKVLEQIAIIDEDYQQSANIPPAPPEWIDAVESMAKLSNENNGNHTTSNILKEIHKTTASQHKSTMDEYRKAVAGHHSALNKLMPYWRKLTNTLDIVSKTVTGLQGRASKIDQKMDEYENINAKTDKTERILSSSSMTQFFISGLVLSIAIAGAIINFNLIALPMSEMVGGGSYISNFKTSDVAALVIILIEISLGLYLMESLRFTHLFPVIGQMDDKMRKRMVWITICFLIILAGIESSLALMRDQIAANNQALLQTLAGGIERLDTAQNLIPTIGQMILGFILPFILTFVAIPLESFIHSSRTVIGVLTVGFLQFLSFILALLSRIFFNTGEVLISLYDVMIFPALWLEKLLLKQANKRADNHKKEQLPENQGINDLEFTAEEPSI